MKQPTRSSERGAILILVAVAIAVLMAFGAFVVDMGVNWMARAEAQTAADSGALAGAIALETQSQADLTTAGLAYNSALTTAQTNGVFGGTTGVHVDLAANLGTWAHPAPAVCSAGGCVQVDVYQDGTNGSAFLPTYFANVFAIAHQGTKATATAQVVTGNASNCLAPYFLIDRYTDVNGDGAFTSPPDLYAPAGSPGATGYANTDIGTFVTFHDNTSPSGYGELSLGGKGVPVIDASLNTCNIGSYVLGNGDIETDAGNKVGQKKGLKDLIDQDPDATWNPVTQKIDNSCAPGGCTCPTSYGPCKYGGLISPRIMQVVICAPTEANCAAGGGGGNPTITPINIISFFMTDWHFMSGNLSVDAVIIGSAGSLANGGAAGNGSASFIKAVQLVR